MAVPNKGLHLDQPETQVDTNDRNKKEEKDTEINMSFLRTHCIEQVDWTINNRTVLLKKVKVTITCARSPKQFARERVAIFLSTGCSG